MAELELSKTQRIRLEQITPNPYQPRKEFDEKGIVELAESIRAQGLVQKIVVIPKVDEKFKVIPEEYYLIAGERRLRAYKKLYEETSERRFSAIEAVVEPVDQLDPDSYKQKLIFDSLAENLNRKDLTPVEKAEAILKIQEETKKTYKEIGEALGIKDTTIQQIVSLYNRLDDKQREEVKKEKLGRRKIKDRFFEKKTEEKRKDTGNGEGIEKVETLARAKVQEVNPMKQSEDMKIVVSKSKGKDLTEEEQLNLVKDTMNEIASQLLNTKDEGEIFDFLGKFFNFYIEDYKDRHLKK